MQNLVEDKFDLRSHGSNDVFCGGITLFFIRVEGGGSLEYTQLKGRHKENFIVTRPKSSSPLPPGNNLRPVSCVIDSIFIGLTLYTLTSAFIFSMLFSVHLLMC